MVSQLTVKTAIQMASTINQVEDLIFSNAGALATFRLSCGPREAIMPN